MGYGPIPGYQVPANSAGPNRKRWAILFVVIMVVVLSSAAFIVLGNRKDPAKIAMVNLAISQTELLRISNDQVKNLTSSDVKRHNADLVATITTTNILTRAELKRVYRVKTISSQQQKAAIDTKVDALLKSAKALNRLDTQFEDVVSEKLADELQLIQQIQGTIKDTKAKEALTTIAKNTSELRDRFASETPEVTE